MNTIADLLTPDDIVLDLDVATKSQLFDAVGRHMECQRGLSREWVVNCLDRREQIGSTGLGQGVAIPHARVHSLNQIVVAYLRLKSPIPFGSPDGEPVTDIVVLLVPKPATDDHLRILADATRLFSDGQFRKELHDCGTRLAVKKLFARQVSA
ncbi:MAG TPA: PTS sugar transporter subunit IIA [Rhodocyclaceae bacterium]|nr:PTS sugar transporter subunit IIA [Rhodocyclaceae bacterium]